MSTMHERLLEKVRELERERKKRETATQPHSADELATPASLGEDLAVRKGKSAITKRWGRAGSRFTQVPNLLLDSKKRLEISDAELVVLLHLLKYWWHDNEESLPFPSTSTLAEVVGKDVRQVQRILHSLENNPAPVSNNWSDQPGYITRVPHHEASGRQRSNRFDLSKLISALNAIADEVDEAAKQAYKRKPYRPAKKARSERATYSALQEKDYL